MAIVDLQAALATWSADKAVYDADVAAAYDAADAFLKKELDKLASKLAKKRQSYDALLAKIAEKELEYKEARKANEVAVVSALVEIAQVKQIVTTAKDN